MTFPKIWPTPLTDHISTVDAAQLNQLDTDHANALDGKDGGTYSTSAILVVGGEGIDHQYLADIAALKAVDTTSLLNNAVRWVKGLGRFVLDKVTNPTFTELLPIVIAPTTGTGRWYAQDAEAKLEYIELFAPGSTTWQCPPNISRIHVDVIAGGGGGGAGSDTSAGTDDAPGGSGGGGGGRNSSESTVTPLASYSIDVGAGGAGATSFVSPGADGQSSSFDGVIGSAGGQGGQGSVANGGAVSLPGGVACGSGSDPLAPLGSSAQWYQHPGAGGYSRNGVRAGAKGVNSPYNGGVSNGGAAGTSSGGQKGGSGGGGGGASVGVGGDGGAGGNGNNSGAAQNGNAGSDGFLGSGGGGGGGAGAGSTGSRTGGAGGKGGDGLIVIRGRA